MGELDGYFCRRSGSRQSPTCGWLYRMGVWQCDGGAHPVLAVETSGAFSRLRMWDYNNGGPPNYAAMLTIQYS